MFFCKVTNNMPKSNAENIVVLLKSNAENNILLLKSNAENNVLLLKSNSKVFKSPLYFAQFQL